MGGSGGGGGNHLGNVASLEEIARNALAGGKKNVFISFDSEDKDEVNLLRAHAKNENSDIEFNDHSVRVPYNSERAEYIRKKISERINRCSITVVYLSDSTVNSQWVKWEVERSLEFGKSVLAVHSGDKYSGERPSWLQADKIKVVPWANLATELK